MTLQPRMFLQSIFWAIITTLVIISTWFLTPVIVNLSQPQKKVAQDPTGLLKIDKQSLDLNPEFSVYRCNNQRTGFIPATATIKIDKVVWRKKTMDQFKSKYDDVGLCATCIVTPGLLITPGEKGTIIGLNPDNGSVKWKTELIDANGNKYQERIGALNANQSYVFAANLETSNLVWLLNRENGKIIWSNKLEAGCFSPALISRDSMIIHGHSGIITGYEKLEKRWTFSTGSDSIYPPTIIPNTHHAIYVNGDGRVYRLNLANGRLLWVAALANPSGSTGVIINNYCYITDRAGYLYALNIKDGSLKWFTEVALLPLDSPASDGKTMVVSGTLGSQRKIIAIDLETKKVLWESKLENLIEFFDPYIIGNQVLTVVGDNKNHLSCQKAELVLIDLATGKENQRFLLNDVPGQSITITSGNLWINTIQGYTLRVAYQ